MKSLFSRLISPFKFLPVLLAVAVPASAEASLGAQSLGHASSGVFATHFVAVLAITANRVHTTATLTHPVANPAGPVTHPVGPITHPGAVTPEPSTWILLATGLFGLGFLSRRRRNEALQDPA